MTNEFTFEVIRSGKLEKFIVKGKAARDSVLHMERLTSTVTSIKINGKTVL